MIYLLFIIAIVVVLAIYINSNNVFGAKSKGERLEKIMKSKNYKNKQFQNLSHTPAITEGFSMTKVMYRFFIAKKDPFLKPKKNVPTVFTDLKNISKEEDVYIWLGHSSYFLQTNGISFLIDPVLSKFGSPVKFFNKAFNGSDIYTPEDLPFIDYLVITHDHYDHLDYPTIKNLKDKVGEIILPLGVGAHFEKWGYKNEIILEEDWGTELKLKNNITINFTPARHFSGRKFKRNSTLWTSYVLKTPTKNIFLGGDSGYDSHFKMIGEKFGPFDFAILENGQYNEAWKYIHAMPEDIKKISQELKAQKIIPVHSGKFALALHPWNEPLELVINNLKNTDIEVLTPQIGEILNLNSTQHNFSTWWRN